MDINNELRNDRIKKSATFFLSPLALICMAVAVILGVFGDNLVGKYNNYPDAYLISVSIVGGAYLLIILITICVALFIFSKDRNSEIVEIINKQPETCRKIQSQLASIQQSANHLRSFLVESELAKAVVLGSDVDNLEASVEKGKRIIIFTSKFVLEGSSEFTKVIISNFRKGVKYKYYVPEERTRQDPFWARVKEWYKEFIAFTQSKEKAKELLRLADEDAAINRVWNDEYKKQINLCLEALSKRNRVQKEAAVNAVKQKLREMFEAQLVSYAFDTNFFFVTVAMYEKNIDDWKAIIKLPTQNPQANFVAFSLENADTHERKEFIESILKLSNDSEQLSYPETIYS
jgi:DNA-binding FrmR family transcriptional regulator